MEKAGRNRGEVMNASSYNPPKPFQFEKQCQDAEQLLRKYGRWPKPPRSNDLLFIAVILLSVGFVSLFARFAFTTIPIPCKTCNNLWKWTNYQSWFPWSERPECVYCFYTRKYPPPPPTPDPRPHARPSEPERKPLEAPNPSVIYQLLWRIQDLERDVKTLKSQR